MADDLPKLTVVDASAWRAWLLDNHAESSGVWLTLARKGSTVPTGLMYSQALDEALCFGWIDGQSHSQDEATFRQRFTPRRRQSAWSKRNVEHALRLESEGRMQAAGRAEMQRAMDDGRWQAAYAGPATIEVPPDLAEALAAQPRATAMFGILTSQNRFAILLRTGQAKTPETRARRIAAFVDMLARGETIYPQKRTLDEF